MPGVPPDAVERVKGLAKRTLKGFFSKRNKDRPQSQASASATPSTRPAAGATSPPPPPPPAKSTEHTTPAITTTTNTLPPAAAVSAPPDTGKALPPTGPQTTKDTALTKDTPALPAATTDGTHDKPPSAVSPATSATAGDSEPVSAMEETPPALPPKNDGDARVGKEVTSTSAPVVLATTTEAPRAGTALDGTTQSPQPPPPTTLQSIVTGAVTKPDNGKPLLSEATATSTAPTVSTTMTDADAAAAAQKNGGMSATSGPLEDFPIRAAKE